MRRVLRRRSSNCGRERGRRDRGECATAAAGAIAAAAATTDTAAESLELPPPKPSPPPPPPPPAAGRGRDVCWAAQGATAAAAAAAAATATAAAAAATAAAAAGAQLACRISPPTRGALYAHQQDRRIDDEECCYVVAPEWFTLQDDVDIDEETGGQMVVSEADAAEHFVIANVRRPCDYWVTGIHQRRARRGRSPFRTT